MRSISLYIHIPFCKRRCSYCTFYHVPHVDDFEDAFVEALVTEFRYATREIGEAFVIPTVFFGGGTPSVLRTPSLGRIVEAMRPFVTSDAEITVEVNPEDVSSERLLELRALGVNRISVGVQSMQPDSLRLLKRCGPEVNARALEAVAACYDNFSADVLIGIPDAPAGETLETLSTVLRFAPTHLSLYCLEPGGVLQEEVAAFFERVDTDRAADEYLAVCDELGRRGFRHYEVSNFARPGFESRHNRVYWRGGEYMGIGPGAHSYVGGRRVHNEPSVERYVERIPKSGDALRRVEPRTATQRHLEDLMLGLRTSDGLSLDRLRGPSQVLDDLVQTRLARRVAGRLVLTDRGYLVLNEIVERLARVA